MKLVHIESNEPKRFGPISFHDGLNVVFARVHDPAARQRSSHNLGKTFLISVIDFVLGADLEKDHAFKKRRDLFGALEFTLQLRTNSGQYVSARRPVHGREANSVLVTDKPVPVGKLPPHATWTHRDLSLNGYRDVLDELFTLRDIEPESYRKGLGFQLRRQPDYADEFQIAKFARGRDIEWRPFLAQLFGFRQEVFLHGYAVEERIKEIKKAIDEIEGSDKPNKQQYDEVRGLIQIREAEIATLREELGRFQFTGVERTVNKALVDDIEATLAQQNLRRYAIDRDLQDIDQSLAAGFSFDLALVQRVYREAGLELPGQIVHDLEDLVEFNRRISSGRNARLAGLRKELVEERAHVEATIDELDKRRQEAMRALREAESFAKYKKLTDHVFGLEADLREHRDRLAALNRAAPLRAELGEKQKELLDAVAAIEAEVHRGNDLFSTVRRAFNEAVSAVLGARAVLSLGLNKQHHIEFKTSILDAVVRDRETHEGKGFSYKKLLCACVDLALLQAHAQGDYYRFVYHDGIFEGLDNRRKVALLEYVRRVTAEHGQQYILTVIDADLPRDERDNKLMFSEDEVILRLHDEGDDGRLFRMPAF